MISPIKTHKMNDSIALIVMIITWPSTCNILVIVESIQNNNTKMEQKQKKNPPNKTKNKLDKFLHFSVLQLEKQTMYIECSALSA